MPKPDGIFVSAILADRILTENNGILSAIRMVDLLNVSGPEKFLIVVDSNLLVLFKSAKPQRFTATIEGFDPDGQKWLNRQDFPIVLNGGAHGHNLLMLLKFTAQKEGIYSIQISADGEVVQWIPIQVTRTSPEPVKSPTPSAS
jgi:hypothetical protein